MQGLNPRDALSAAWPPVLLGMRRQVSDVLGRLPSTRIRDNKPGRAPDALYSGGHGVWQGGCDPPPPLDFKRPCRSLQARQRKLRTATESWHQGLRSALLIARIHAGCDVL